MDAGTRTPKEDVWTQTAVVLGYRVSTRGLSGDAEAAMAMVASGQKGRFVSTINPHSTVVACDNGAFKQALLQADLLLPDGIGIVLAAKVLGQAIAERVAGFEFFCEFSRRAQEQGGISYYFLGSSDAVLAAISRRLAVDFPAIRIVGMRSPPFKPEFTETENAEMCRAINDSGADVLWVGMTAPKQELWIVANRHRLNPAFSAAIGAVFDFYAGTKSRAPVWAQRIGVEWLFRLMSEPRHVWRRYVLNIPRFVLMVLQNKFHL